MKFPEGSLKDRLKRARDRARVSLYTYGRGAIHYRVASTALDREADAVFAGIQAHHSRVRTGSELFELRRRVHMIEKGLTMRPRRDTFAVAYIDLVLDRLSTAMVQGLLTDEMIAWSRDVLDGYFDATSSSPNAVIAAARDRYRGMNLTSSMPYLGPGGPTVGIAAANFDDLCELAQRRRSVRWFDDRPVDRATVDRAIAMAIEAPTACNRVPYSFRVFDRPEDARRVAAIAGGTAGYVHNLNAVMVLVGDLSAYVDERDRHLIYIDGSLAAMSLLLGLEVQGVSSCCINWPDLRRPEKEIRRLLDLAPYERVVMLIAYGHADPDGLAPVSPKVPLNMARKYEVLANGE
ncbi:nitroreductase family protein [Aeromicrobium piscarium]|nr:nitroreductase family protein [Aeromicrobium piscarium]